MNDFCEVCGSTLADGCPNGHEQSTYSADRERIIALMQNAVRNYLEPTTYFRKTRNEGGSMGRVEMPSKHQEEESIRSIQRRRDDMFISDIIYFLDSDEYGTNKKPASA